jgi:ABC-type branched-subunit amino acid transport system substrate-binding protein
LARSKNMLQDKAIWLFTVLFFGLILSLTACGGGAVLEVPQATATEAPEAEVEPIEVTPETAITEIAEASPTPLPEATATEVAEVAEVEATEEVSPEPTPSEVPEEKSAKDGPLDGPLDAPLDGPVSVGVLLPATGEMGWISNAIDAVELAISEINDAGGAAGQPITLRAEDSETVIVATVAGAKKLLEVEEVVALIGPTSATYRPVIPLVQKHGVVNILPTAGTIELDTMSAAQRQNIYRTVSSDTVMGTGMASYAANELGAKKVALFFADAGSAISVADVLRAASNALGMEIVADVTFTEEATSYRSELEELSANAPEVIFFESGPESSTVLFREVNELGVEANWLGTNFVNDAFIEAAGQNGEGVIGVNPAPEVTERYEQWRAKLEALRGQEGVPTSSANAYDAMMIIALAAEAAGEASREGIAEKLYDVASPPGEVVTTFAEGQALLAKGKDINYQGIAGPQDFNELGDVITSLQAVVVQNGQIERVGTLTQEDIAESLEQVLEQLR